MRNLALGFASFVGRSSPPNLLNGDLYIFSCPEAEAEIFPSQSTWKKKRKKTQINVLRRSFGCKLFCQLAYIPLALLCPPFWGPEKNKNKNSWQKTIFLSGKPNAKSPINSCIISHVCAHALITTVAGAACCRVYGYHHARQDATDALAIAGELSEDAVAC